MGIGDVIKAFRRLDALLALEAKHGEAINNLAQELSAVQARMIRLESREEIVVSEARGAAAAAAGQVTLAAVSDIARRVGRLEALGETARLLPPTS